MDDNQLTNNIPSPLINKLYYFANEHCGQDVSTLALYLKVPGSNLIQKLAVLTKG
jgi:hypothetical protein